MKTKERKKGIGKPVKCRTLSIQHGKFSEKELIRNNAAQRRHEQNLFSTTQFSIHVILRAIKCVDFSCAANSFTPCVHRKL